jgi:RNA polymerase-binding protein DksA
VRRRRPGQRHHHRAAELTAPIERLNTDRISTTERIAAMTRDFERMVASAESSNADDEHDPEGQTIAYERSQLTALIEQARRHLVEIDRALEELAAGAYGVCKSCGSQISEARLEARPTAVTCISCAQQQ